MHNEAKAGNLLPLFSRQLKQTAIVAYQILICINTRFLHAMKYITITAMLMAACHAVLAENNPFATYRIPRGIIIDTVWNQRAGNESYTLYLPSCYNDSSHLPVIYFFEPGARGSLPVNHYKEIAENNGLILVCSNNICNGEFIVMETFARHLFDDVETRFHIDTGHIFYSGFSGCARFAFGLAQQNQKASGVIGCGAGFPFFGTVKNRFSFFYSGIVGVMDMNYSEMCRNKMILDSLGYDHYLIIHEGGHEWPPADIFNEALWWIMIRDNLKGPEKIPELYRIMLSSLNNSRSQNSYYSACLKAEEIKKTFKHTAFGTRADSIMQRLSADPFYARQIKELKRISKVETDFQLEIYNAFKTISNIRYNLDDTVHTYAWWKAQYRWIKKISGCKELEMQKLGTRSDQLVVSIAYEEGIRYVSEKDYKRSVIVHEIFVIFRPESYYGYLQLARSYAGMNQTRKTSTLLEIARKKGLKTEEIKGIEELKNLNMN
jgi:hypothetical protein